MESIISNQYRNRTDVLFNVGSIFSITVGEYQINACQEHIHSTKVFVIFIIKNSRKMNFICLGSDLYSSIFAYLKFPSL